VRRYPPTSIVGSIAYQYVHLSDEIARANIRVAADVDDAIAAEALAECLANPLPDAVSEREPATSRATLPVLDGAALFALEPQPLAWRVDTLLPIGRQGAMFGSPGIGKSTLMRHFVGSMLSGTPALGRFAVQPGPADWVTAEEDPAEIAFGFALVAAGNGYDIRAIRDGLRVVPLRDQADVSFAKPGTIDALEALIRERGTGLLVLDAYGSLGGIDLNDPQAVGPILRRFGMLASATGCCVCWIAHDRKNNSEGSDIDALFGSRQNAALIDFAHRIVPAPSTHDDIIIRSAKMRGAARPHDLHVEMISKADELHSATVQQAPDDAQMLDIVRLYLIASPGASMSETRDMVAERARRRPADVGEYLHLLLSRKVIENRGSARRFALHWLREAACPDVSQ
jgi:hypothetical protein